MLRSTLNIGQWKKYKRIIGLTKSPTKKLFFHIAKHKRINNRKGK